MPTPVMLVTQFLDGGGSERQVRQTAAALDPSRFGVHVAFFRPDTRRESELRDAGVQTVYLPLHSYASTGAVQAALQLRRYLKQHGIQLIHAFDNPSSTFAIPIARMSGTPIALGSQRSNRRLLGKNQRRLRRIADRFAHGIVVNAPDLVEHLRNDEGISSGRIHFCPNGLDTGQFSPSGRRRLPGLESASLVIGCIATHRPEKQLPFLVDAFAEMRRLRPGLKLVLVGSGTETQKIVDRVTANGLGEDCLMIPHTPDTSAMLKSIDIFILASTTEGTSNSIAEAMASGCAVIASNVEGTRDLVRDGSTGLLFEPGNQADLVSKVLALVDDNARRAEFAGNSAQWVRSNMSLRDAAAHMGRIYDDYLIGKGLIKERVVLAARD